MLFSESQMSTDAKLLPLLNESLEETETIHDILFAAKGSFSNAILERPSGSNPKDKPKLFDGEKILLNAIDRALLHAKQTDKKLSAQRDEILRKATSKERARNNYLTALRILAEKRRKKCVISKPPTVPSPKRSLRQNQHVSSSMSRWPEPISNNSLTTAPRIYTPATKLFPAWSKVATKPCYQKVGTSESLLRSNIVPENETSNTAKTQTLKRKKALKQTVLGDSNFRILNWTVTLFCQWVGVPWIVKLPISQSKMKNNHIHHIQMSHILGVGLPFCKGRKKKSSDWMMKV